jgi:hypothetical protein
MESDLNSSGLLDKVAAHLNAQSLRLDCQPQQVGLELRNAPGNNHSAALWRTLHFLR